MLLPFDSPHRTVGMGLFLTGTPAVRVRTSRKLRWRAHIVSGESFARQHQALLPPLTHVTVPPKADGPPEDIGCGSPLIQVSLIVYIGLFPDYRGTSTTLLGSMSSKARGELRM